jgi:hypothetical protein
MNRRIWALVFVLAGACGKSDAEKAIARLDELNDAMCACKDVACTTQVAAETDAWQREFATVKLTDDQAKIVSLARSSMENCQAGLRLTQEGMRR